MNNLTIKNKTDVSADLYVYGEIVGEKYFDSDVDCEELKELANEMQSGTLNLYINSPGGSVFTASAMCSILKRMQDKGVKVNAYIDGVAASAATFLVMQSDEINVYKNSMMMIHKPSAMAYGNADDLKKTIDLLDEIEISVMLPLYRNKAKVCDDAIMDMVSKETWLNAADTSEIFNVNLVDEERKCAALDKTCFDRYLNTPEEVKKQFTEEQKTHEEAHEPIDYSEYQKRIQKVGGNL